MTIFDGLIKQLQTAVTPVTVNPPEGAYLITHKDQKVEIPPAEPRITSHFCSTLTGFVDYVNGNPDGLETMHVLVTCPRAVRAYLPAEGRHKSRPCPIIADCGSILVEGFDFGTWMNSDRFVINCMSQFVQTAELLELLNTISNTVAEDSVQVSDSGLDQSVVVRSGIATLEEAFIPRRPILSPYRTFNEINQPASEFVLRRRVVGSDGDKSIQFALFEADGGQWKLQAMQDIAEFLRGELGDDIIIIA